MNLLKDFLACEDVCKGRALDNYSLIYFKCNENIGDFFPCFDFNDKDVLSVAASSDQAFMANYLGARSTDIFDKNDLAHYYLYLRKWQVKYNNELYPEEILDNNYLWLSDLLSKVEPSSNRFENAAFKFWYMHLKHKTNFRKLFFSDPRDGITIDKVDNKFKKAVDKKYSFRRLDLFDKEITYMSNKYDIVLLSNILEWARSNDKYILNTKNNLYKILKDDGIVLCSSLMCRSKESIDLERYIFSDDFNYQNYGRDKGYVYRKK